MKFRTVILSALTTVTVSSLAFAADGQAGGGGAPPVTDVPYFKEVTSLWFPPQPCNDPDNPFKLGCYTNFLTIADLDGDGDLDIVFANGGYYYVPDQFVSAVPPDPDVPNDTGKPAKIVSGKESSTVFLNDGHGGFRDATTLSFGGATSRLRQVAIADVDGDGDMDLYQPGGYGLDYDKLFIQTAPAVFEDQAFTLFPPGMRSHAGSAHFGDLDNDGDMDLVIGDWGATTPLKSDGNTLLYLNDGKGKFALQPANSVPPPMDWMTGAGPLDIDLADIDGDYDLDILVDHRNGQSRIYLNDGHAKFSDATENYPQKNGPYTYNVEACDFDEDGDLDLLLDNAGGNITTDDFFGNISQVLVNDGKGKFSDETKDIISGEPYADDNAVKCADVNGDGHYDFVVASLALPEKLILNDGTGHFNFVPGAFPEIYDPTLGIDIGDLDGDHKIDVVTGQGEGTPRMNLVYKGSDNSVADTTPPKFRGVETPTAIAGAPIVMHLAVTDAYTSETGQEVKSVFVSYKVNGGQALKAPATFVGGDLFRVVIPAQPAFATLELTPTAIDRVDLTGTAATMTLSLGGLTGEAGAGGAGDAGAGGEGGIAEGEAGAATAGAMAGGTGGKGGANGLGGKGGASEEGGAAGEGTDTTPVATSDDGCSCSVVGHRSSKFPPLLAGLAVAFYTLRRKRRAARS